MVARAPDLGSPPVECGVSDATELPALPGAYSLLIRLADNVALPACCDADSLAPGRYVYFGSAKGGGGIRARCRRHLDPEKKLHWHVDRLTVGAEPGRVLAVGFPADTECALAARLLRAGGLAMPVHGFGNSDCRVCPAHLFALGKTVSWERVLEVLRDSER